VIIGGAGYAMKELKIMKMVTISIIGLAPEQVPIPAGVGYRLIQTKKNTL